MILRKLRDARGAPGGRVGQGSLPETRYVAHPVPITHFHFAASSHALGGNLLHCRRFLRLGCKLDVPGAHTRVFVPQHPVQTYSIGATHLNGRITECFEPAADTQCHPLSFPGRLEPTLQQRDPPLVRTGPCGTTDEIHPTVEFRHRLLHRARRIRDQRAGRKLPRQSIRETARGLGVQNQYVLRLLVALNSSGWPPCLCQHAFPALSGIACHGGSGLRRHTRRPYIRILRPEDPISLAREGIRRQADASRRPVCCVRGPLGIELPPIIGKALRPQLEQLVVLALVEPRGNQLHGIGVAMQAREDFSGLSGLAVEAAVDLPAMHLTSQMGNQDSPHILQGGGREGEPMVHRFPSGLQRVGQIEQFGLRERGAVEMIEQLLRASPKLLFGLR